MSENTGAPAVRTRPIASVASVLRMAHSPSPTLPTYVFGPLFRVRFNECAEKLLGVIHVQVNDPRCHAASTSRSHSFPENYWTHRRQLSLCRTARSLLRTYDRASAGVHRHTAEALHALAARIVETIYLSMHDCGRTLQSEISTGATRCPPPTSTAAYWDSASAEPAYASSRATFMNSSIWHSHSLISYTRSYFRRATPAPQAPFTSGVSRGHRRRLPASVCLHPPAAERLGGSS